MTNAIDFLEDYLKGRGRMKAEDTVMSNGALLELFGTTDFSEREGREAQAEISFKAGIKEVVEWIDGNSGLDSNVSKTWQVQKKKWGIE